MLGRTFVTLQTLQTVVVEIEGMLNDQPLTYASIVISDPEPLAPVYLMYGRMIVSAPIHILFKILMSVSYLIDQDMRKATSGLSKLLQKF